MKFYINPSIELLKLDNEEEVAFDPASGDTHFLDSVASDILRILQEAKNIDELASSLASEYDADSNEIKSDISPFLAELAEKGIIKTEL